jgi:hypothetical protein
MPAMAFESPDGRDFIAVTNEKQANYIWGNILVTGR